MLREFTCIICLNGCEIRAEVGEKENRTVEILSIKGAACKKGDAYVGWELKNPRRSVAAFVLVEGGILPLASVRLTPPIPKCRILDAMAEIRGCTLTAPIEAGTMVIHTPLRYDTNVIVTKKIPVSTEK